MVHKKYIKKNGKTFGPYYYNTKRINGKVITSYVGKDLDEKEKKSDFWTYYFFGAIILLVILLFSFDKTDTLFSARVISEDLEQNLEEITSVVTSQDSKVSESAGISAEITTFQYGAVLGQPVRWTKKVKLSKPSDISIELPKNAENFKIINVVKEEVLEEVSSTENTLIVTEIVEDEQTDTNTETTEVIENDIGTVEVVSEENTGKSVISEEITTEPIVEENNEADEVVIDITGNVILRDNAETNFFNRFFKATGLFLIEEDTTEPVTVEVKDILTEVEIDYETPAPYSEEIETSSGKTIKVIGPEEVHYQNVLIFSELDEDLDIQSSEELRIYWEEEKQYVKPKNVLDLDENGILDYIEFVAPQLSNQTFSIIVVTHAEHLDVNREFISDVYDSISELDGIWSETILDGHYVRVIFERQLTHTNDITVYPRIVSGTPIVEVYKENDNNLITSFDPVNSDVRNRVVLTGLEEETDTFDLKVIGGELQFDHIIDPSVTACSVLNESGAVYTQTQDIVASGTTPCINITAQNVSFSCGGFTIWNGTADFTSDLIWMGANNITVANCPNLTNSQTSGRDAIEFSSGITGAYISNITCMRAAKCISVPSSMFNATFINVVGKPTASGFVPTVIDAPNGGGFFNISNITCDSASICLLFIGFKNYTTISWVNFSRGAAGSAGILLGGDNNQMHFSHINLTVAGAGISLNAGSNLSNSTFNYMLITNSSNSLGDALLFGGSGYNLTFNRTIITNINRSHYSLKVNSSNGFNDTTFINSYIENYTFNGTHRGLKIVSPYGEIKFLDGINGTGNNFTYAIRIENNSAFVDSANDTGLNKSANVTLFGLSTILVNPVMMRNGIACPAGVCYNFTSLNAGTVIFNVSGWTSFSVEHVATEGAVASEEDVDSDASYGSTAGSGGNKEKFVEPEVSYSFGEQEFKDLNSIDVALKKSEEVLIKLSDLEYVVRFDSLQLGRAYFSTNGLNRGSAAHGEEILIDLDFDGTSDILIKVTDTRVDEVFVSISSIEPETAEAVSETVQTSPPEETQDLLSKLLMDVLKWKLQIIGILVMIMIILAIVLIKKRNKLVETNNLLDKTE